VLGLYVHVPFCAAICNYCNFNRGLFDEALKTRYVGALLAEIGRAGDGAPADTIFFGGGTPSLLEPAEIAAVVAALRGAFAVAPGAEVTLEANPETVTADRLAAYREAGVNRVSFGAQSFRDEELVRLSRLHSAGRAAAAVGEALEAGFDNVSLDLMMWLPQQTIAQWLGSVERLIEVSPDHASLYLLELYPNAPLRETMARERWSLAPDDDAADMYLAAMERLDAAGYAQYEISNVARAGRVARHNLKYWEDGEWLGFGCGAHSTRDGRRWKNLSATVDYVTAVGHDEPVVVEARVLSPQERAEEAAFTGLRLTAGVDLHAIHGRYGVDLWAERRVALAPFVEAGILTYDVGRLRLSRRGMLLANEVMAALLGPVVLE
jgi:oxygen-independent coproporphyrinogen-3 oxidase